MNEFVEIFGSYYLWILPGILAVLLYWGIVSGAGHNQDKLKTLLVSFLVVMIIGLVAVL